MTLIPKNKTAYVKSTRYDSSSIRLWMYMRSCGVLQTSKGDLPSAFNWSALPPFSINAIAVSPWPSSQARCSGVFACPSLGFTLHFASKRSLTIAVCPCTAARCLMEEIILSTSFISKLEFQFPYNGVCLMLFGWFSSALCSSKALTT